MALFKEKICAHCGKRAKFLRCIALEDDQYICGNCVEKIPSSMSMELSGREYNDFLRLSTYVTKTSPQLKKQFRQTQRYKEIHLDIFHELFYLDGIHPRVYFRLMDVTYFSLSFTGEEVKTVSWEQRLRARFV